MILTKRERYLLFGAVGAGAICLCFALYVMVIEPAMVERRKLISNLDEKRKEIDLARYTIQSSKRTVTTWKTASQAQSETEKAIEGWRLRSGDDRRPLKITKLRPDPTPEKDKDYYRLTEHVEAEGTNEQIGRFLYQIQTATIPVRTLDVTIRPKAEVTGRSGRDSSNERVLTLSVGTIFTEPDAKRADPAARETGR